MWASSILNSIRERGSSAVGQDNQPEQDGSLCRNRTRLGHGTKFDGLVEVEERVMAKRKTL
jgi:hypothetical protein